MRVMAMAAAVGAAALGMAAPAQAAGKLDVLYSFCPQSGCTDGDQPYAGVTLTGSGRLIGTTGFGGAYNGGTVFELAAKTGKLRILKSFCVGKPPSCQSDEGPSVTLVADTAGDIFGTVYFGGANAKGAVFELKAKSGRRYALDYLYSFNGTDGAGPADLSYAGQSTGARYDGTSPLYGTTLTGGTNNAGIVYSLTPSGGQWNFQTVYNFCSAANCSDGGLPRGAVTVDPSGALYGTTGYYGGNNDGTIYKLTNNAGIWSETTLHTFCANGDCSDGSGPFAGVAEDALGNLYGTTYFGGAQNSGVVFEQAADGIYSVLYNFCSLPNCADGSAPDAAVTLDSSGRVFGTTSRGGDGNYGAMFEIAGGTYKRLYSYCSQGGCSDGGYPYGTLVLDYGGRLYGTTQYGGANGLGEVYRLKP